MSRLSAQIRDPRAHRRIRAAGALAASLAFGSAAGRAEESAPRHVTLEQAIERAVLAPELVATRAEVEAARSAEDVAGGFGDLGLTFATHTLTARESFSGSLPLDLLKRAAREDSARADTSVAEREVEVARVEAFHAMRSAWFELATGEDQVVAARERERAMTRIRDSVASLFEAGRVPRVEKVRADAEAALASAEAADLGERAQGARAVLGALMGIDGSFDTGMERPLPPEEGSLQRWLSAIEEREAGILLGLSKLEAAERRIEVAERETWPNVALEGGVDWNDPTQPGADATIGISLSIPLGSGSRSDQARAERAALAGRLEGGRAKARAAVEDAWHRVRAARAHLQVIDESVLPAANEAAELAGLGYREGRDDLVGWLDAQRAWADARAGRAEAYGAWGLAYADLLAAAGLGASSGDRLGESDGAPPRNHSAEPRQENPLAESIRSMAGNPESP